MDYQYSEQPLCFSVKEEFDTDTLCQYCLARGCFYPYQDDFGTGVYPTECSCQNTSKYKSYVICKVLIPSPGRGLDTTTTIRLMIKVLKNVYCHSVSEIKDDIVYNHFDSEVVFDFTIGLDGGILDEDYTKILDLVSRKYVPIDYSFSGQHSKQRYIEFVRERIEQSYMKKLDLPQENGHVGRKIKSKAKK